MKPALLRLSRRVLRGVEWRLESLLRERPRVEPGTPPTHVEAVKASAARYDMHASRDEQFYARIYMHWLRKFVFDRAGAAPRVLDVGTGQGRLALAIAGALPGAHVTGIDLSPASIAAASGYARQASLANVTFLEADAIQYLASLDRASVDVVICAEVAFWLPEFEQIIAQSRRVLKPGGVLAMSFWSQYYRMLGSVRDRRWASARELLSARRGNITGTAVTFTWQTPDDVREIMTRHAFEIDALVGIGVCSGIAEVGDALAPIAQPSLLGSDDMGALMDLEIAAGDQFAGNARYMLAIARSPREMAA